MWRFLRYPHAVPDRPAARSEGRRDQLLRPRPLHAYEALAKLARGEHPATSWLGIGLAVASLIIMPFPGTAKKCLGTRLDSKATTASGVQNVICAYLAAAVLAGLFANTGLG